MFFNFELLRGQFSNFYFSLRLSEKLSLIFSRTDVLLTEFYHLTVVRF
jgi:hypothetical protein